MREDRLIGRGHEPQLQIFHDDKKRRGTYPAFALDRMDPMRPIVDRAILKLIQAATLSGADFSIQDDDVCPLKSDPARFIAQRITSLNSRVSRLSRKSFGR